MAMAPVRNLTILLSFAEMIIQILDRIIYRYIIFLKVAAFVFNKPTKLSKIVRFLTGAIAMFVMSSHSR
jgi:hypothetical protein